MSTEGEARSVTDCITHPILADAVMQVVYTSGGHGQLDLEIDEAILQQVDTWIRKHPHKRWASAALHVGACRRKPTPLPQRGILLRVALQAYACAIRGRSTCHALGSALCGTAQHQFTCRGPILDEDLWDQGSVTAVSFSVAVGPAQLVYQMPNNLPSSSGMSIRPVCSPLAGYAAQSHV